MKIKIALSPKALRFTLAAVTREYERLVEISNRDDVPEDVIADAANDAMLYQIIGQMLSQRLNEVEAMTDAKRSLANIVRIWNEAASEFARTSPDGSVPLRKLAEAIEAARQTVAGAACYVEIPVPHDMDNETVARTLSAYLLGAQANWGWLFRKEGVDDGWTLDRSNDYWVHFSSREGTSNVTARLSCRYDGQQPTIEAMAKLFTERYLHHVRRD